jgi:hypothetical protein
MNAIHEILPAIDPNFQLTPALEDDYALNIGFSRMYYFSIYLISVDMNLAKASITI